MRLEKFDPDFTAVPATSMIILNIDSSLSSGECKYHLYPSLCYSMQQNQKGTHCMVLEGSDLKANRR